MANKFNKKKSNTFGQTSSRLGLVKRLAKKFNKILFNRIEELERNVAFKERALLSQRVYLKKIIDHNPHYIYSKNIEGKYTMVNQATADLFGSSIEELIGLTNEEINPYLNNNEALNKQDLQVFNNGMQQFIPLEPIIDKEGKLNWFQTNKTPITNAMGEVEEVISVSTDITKRVEIENELRQNEQRYRSIYENNYSGIIVINKDYNIVNVNQAFVRITGNSENDLKSKNLFDLINPKMIEEGKSLFRGLKRREFTQFNMELTFLSKQKEVIYTNAFVSGLYDEEQIFREAVITIQDVTNDKVAAKRLKESEERFRTLVENAPEAILMMDFEDKKYILTNENAERLLGFGQGELIGKTVGDFSPERLESGATAVDKVHYYLQQAVDGKKVVYDWPIKRKDGSIVHCEVRVVRMPAKDRILLRTSLIDITDRKKAEEVLKGEKERVDQTNIRLTRLNEILNLQKKQLSDFAYIASHNLRAPAGNIKQLISFYGHDTTEEGKEYFFNQLNVVADNLLDTINDLAEVVKIKSRSEVVKDKINLTSIVDKVIGNITQEIEISKAKISTKFEGANEFYFSKSYMESMIQNLLTNAIKYRDPERTPKIELKCVEEEGKYVISCKDNGLGLDLEKHGDKLFGLRKTFHRNVDARGVGLFITKAQVESFGGEIHVKSKPGSGSTFTIELPKTNNNE